MGLDALDHITTENSFLKKAKKKNKQKQKQKKNTALSQSLCNNTLFNADVILHRTTRFYQRNNKSSRL
jgi:hypothetical protein